jgi:hypothetical protein
VEVRRLARGSAAFYFRIPTHYRKLGCEMANEPLGTSYEAACGDDGKGGRAATLNGMFDEWNDQRKGEAIEPGRIARYGTIDWLFRQYKTEKAYTEKVSPRSRPDYERIMQMVCDTVGKSGRRIGERQIIEVTPRAADKIYDKIINGPNGLRLRQGEKVVGLCRKVWRIMRRLHPELFDKKHPNPWNDFTLKSRTKTKKHAVSREEVYKFAWLHHGGPARTRGSRSDLLRVVATARERSGWVFDLARLSQQELAARRAHRAPQEQGVGLASP